MKKIYSLLTVCALALTANAQVFWTEDFGAGCSTGTLASAYSGTNGAWTVTATGTNDTYCNVLYISAEESGNAVGACGTGCSGAGDRSLHVGASAALTGDGGAAYFSGGFCGSGICCITNTSARSPLINCLGKTSITLSFAYMEGGQTTLDDASLYYSADGGTTWSLLDNMAKTALGTCAPQGMWVAYSFALPASADNNPNVKIGFNWTNNDDAAGADPSFAVDDITLSVLATGIADASANGLNIFASGNIITVNSAETVQLQGVYDVLGSKIAASMENNTINLEVQSAGIYFVRLEMKGQVYTKKVFIK